ncbi:hypothetical protein HOT49_gp087 [Erwinia phage vB_EamM_Alexandra]|uniref:Uncharacterized protein n=1 Tax=Erwinia phage vB_EamM_Alexandra TaxID=2201424 RepID=A0A2Z4QE49_9CAUD|nr:hypothetical protein HOT49_gp087 [Erwinia phage vB_EamM_Alexandra]AWY08363.1 hypothetical protein Alexandra_87 [Erwinia phage vB_EamM_Alexandra]
MKIINNRIMAQSVLGTGANTATLVNDPNVGAGWNIFAFTGKLPTSKEGFEAAFNNKSVADMFNKSIGMIRAPISGLENGNVLTLALQSQYIPKGASYYGTIGSANTVVYQLVPHRIVRSDYTDRSIATLMGGGSYAVPNARLAGAAIDFEFDTPVTIKYLKYGSAPTNGFALLAVSDEGVESALGTSSVLPGDANCLVLSAPVASKKYRLKPDGVAAQAPMILLSAVDVPSSSPATAPTWAALAHCNTLTHGDINYSDEIMFAADAVGTQGPFKIIGDIIPAQKTVMYCPKLRFSQRSN